MTDKRDGWFLRRIMRLTWLEKLGINTVSHGKRTARRAQALLDKAPMPAEPQCLEVGCGQGAVTRILVQDFNAKVITTDYDEKQLALAKNRLADLPASQVEFRQADARSLSFDDSSFDLVVAFEVWHHIPGGWREAAAEVSRVLRPGGVFIFTDEVLSPKAGRLVSRLLRMDPLADDTLRDELVKHDLQLQHYELKRSFFSFLGLKQCEGVAVKGR